MSLFRHPRKVWHEWPLGRLAALTPPPRLHLIRYHGVLAPHAADRALIVATAAAITVAPTQANATAPHVLRLSWARLLARVFAIDAERCPQCGGRMKWVAVLTDAHALRT